MVQTSCSTKVEISSLSACQMHVLSMHTVITLGLIMWVIYGNTRINIRKGWHIICQCSHTERHGCGEQCREIDSRTYENEKKQCKHIKCSIHIMFTNLHLKYVAIQFSKLLFKKYVRGLYFIVFHSHQISVKYLRCNRSETSLQAMWCITQGKCKWYYCWHTCKKCHSIHPVYSIQYTVLQYTVLKACASSMMLQREVGKWWPLHWVLSPGK